MGMGGCVCVWVRVCVQLLSRVQLLVNSWTEVHQAPLFLGFPRQEYWSGLPLPSPEIFPTQGPNLSLLHWQWWLEPGLATLALRATIALRVSSVQLLSHVWLFVTSGTAACQASLSITNSWSLLKLLSIESVMPSNHLIFCCPLLPPSIFPSIRVFSNESVLRIRWPKYWSFSFTISLPMNIQDWSPLGWTGWISLQSKGLSRVFSNTTV